MCNHQQKRDYLGSWGVIHRITMIFPAEKTSIYGRGFSLHDLDVAGKLETIA